MPGRSELARWLAFECQANVVLRVPGADYGVLAAAQRVGLTILAADGRTPVAAAAPHRKTRRFFPPWQRPGRALSAA